MSGSETQPEQVDAAKKKKPPRACDMCRRRKRRCDGTERCSYCLTHNWSCTYREPAAIRIIPEIPQSQFLEVYEDDYIADLKMWLEAAEATLQQIKERGPSTKNTIKRIMEPFEPPHPDDSDLANTFGALSLENAPSNPGFQGKSSATALVRAVVAEKSRAKRDQLPTGYQSSSRSKQRTVRLPEAYPPIPQYMFPENDLMATLVDLYFSNINVFIPLLHRPVFLECINERLYLGHNGFASTLLLVCALGSLYLSDTSLSSQDREGLAWRWYGQVELCGHTLRQQPTFYDLQSYCLAAEFLNWTSNPRVCWSVIGFGLRLAQDIGSHRHKVPGSCTPAEEELEKRAFWILLRFETELSATLGRPAYLDHLDIDIGILMECDDEYWTTTGPGRQPTSKPPVVAFFNCLINLDRIVMFILQTFYRLNSYLPMVHITDLRPVVVDIDAALQKWLSTIPAHLVWDPEGIDPLFAAQSAALHCCYYYTRLLIYRPFLPAMHPTIQTGLPTQEICVDAARACICIAEKNLEWHSDTPLPFSQSPLFTAAMVLLLAMWDPETTQEDVNQHLLHIHTAIRVLKAQEPRWPSSTFLREVLERLLTTDGSPPAEADTLYDSDYLTSIAVSTSANFHVDGDTNGPSRMAAIPPVFVGDEVIRPGRFHRPQNIP
ncbi:fungal-specific transcription factor domain-containing protein [Mycena maculata]|uniref:Fungal-specific transcription factor domain-containing protein n=1 Tax=Mycena maculata TaxID=230809 RepID=A0AAD7NAK9_9AGAR|nr:fungal-specific transcription factor domain-containing protein [Mycena maculata]